MSNVTFDDLLTPDVYSTALRYAVKFSRRMGPLHEPEDLVHNAIRRVLAHYRGRYGDIRNLGSLLSKAIYTQYLDWISPIAEVGPNKPLADRLVFHLATGCLTDFEDPVDENGYSLEISPVVPPPLRVSPETDHKILQHDVEIAIAQLSPQNQRVVRAYMQTGSLREAAAQVGLSHVYVWQRLPSILTELRELLSDYAPLPPGKRSSDLPQDDVA